jgi:hypothetical protein
MEPPAFGDSRRSETHTGASFQMINTVDGPPLKFDFRGRKYELPKFEFWHLYAIEKYYTEKRLREFCNAVITSVLDVCRSDPELLDKSFEKALAATRGFQNPSYAEVLQFAETTIEGMAVTLQIALKHFYPDEEWTLENAYNLLPVLLDSQKNQLRERAAADVVASD